MRLSFDEPIADASQEAPVSQENKACPYCAEQILAAAIKCKHCGEFLTNQKPAVTPAKNNKWYHSTMTMIGALATLGPLALPMVWTNPRYNLFVKLFITIAVIGATIGMCYALIFMYNKLIDQVHALGI